MPQTGVKKCIHLTQMAPRREHPDRPRGPPDRLTESSFRVDRPNRSGLARPRCVAFIAPLALPAITPATSASAAAQPCTCSVC